MAFRTKRVYDAVSKMDGHRVLVDRVWPRGIKKEQLQADEWKKSLAPSSDLRKWFKHDPDKWEQFKQRYFGELAQQPNEINELLEKGNGHNVTLLYSAKDEKHNNAIALKEFLDQQTN